MVLPSTLDSGTVNPVLSGQSKRRPNIGFQDRLSLDIGQKYCRMQLLTFFKLPFVIKTSVLSIFERPFKTGLTALIAFVQMLRIKAHAGESSDAGGLIFGLSLHLLSCFVYASVR